MAVRYYHTFNALRFFAFFKVFLHHLPAFGIAWFGSLTSGGGIGVQFFFVLSGFLITTILKDERQTFENISFKRYMIRRILRIWPLYFVILGLSAIVFFLFKDTSAASRPEFYQPNWWMSILFLENYQMMFTDKFCWIPTMVVTWSVCVEEHFYILWGILFVIVPLRKMKYVLWALVFIGPITRTIYGQYDLWDIDLPSNLDLFAIGGLVGYYQSTSSFILRLSLQPAVYRKLYLLLVILITFIIPHVDYPGLFVFQPLLLAFLFGGVLIAVLKPDVSVGLTDKNIFSKLGKYTYGLYLTHIIPVSVAAALYQAREEIGLTVLGEPAGIVGLVLLTLLITIFGGKLTYTLIERPFLNLKRYFYPSK